MTGPAGNDANVRFRYVQSRHRGDVDMTSSAPKIVIVGFRLAICRRRVRVVPEL